MSLIKILLKNKVIKAIVVLLGAGYILSPIDLMPEAILKHFGLFDDAAVLIYLYFLIKRKPEKIPENIKEKVKEKIKDFKEKNIGGDNSEKNTASQKRGIKKLSPYEVLEIDSNANEKEIKTAYKKLLSQYHPDKVNHLGDELKYKAKEKTLELKKAYEELIA